MEFLKYFKDYILTESEGFGNNYFHVKKVEKGYDYYFKIGEKTDAERGLIIKIGKFSKSNIINEAETAYGVMSIEEITPEDMDSFLVDEAPYRSKAGEKINLSNEELNRVVEITEKILDDYLQKSPKVVKLYNEFLENIDMDRTEFFNIIQSSIETWSHGRWNTQDGASERSIIHDKLSHE